jgi:hypothetical protein
MVEITTAAFLVIVFVAAEFYRFRRRVTGAVLEILLEDGDPTGIAGARLKVKTSEAADVTAFISGCQMCMSPIEIGAIVSLVPCGNGYVVASPWVSSRRHGAPCTMTSNSKASTFRLPGFCADSSLQPPDRHLQSTRIFSFFACFRHALGKGMN